MEELISISAIVGFFTAVILVVWFAAQTIQHRSNVRSMRMNKLLDKFGTAEEFLKFAESEGGAEVIRGISGGEQDEGPQIMKSVRRGVISAALGIGGIFVGGIMNEEGFAALGVLALALGIGFLVSAYIVRRFEKTDRETPESPDAERQMPESFDE